MINLHFKIARACLCTMFLFSVIQKKRRSFVYLFDKRHYLDWHKARSLIKCILCPRANSIINISSNKILKRGNLSARYIRLIWKRIRFSAASAVRLIWFYRKFLRSITSVNIQSRAFNISSRLNNFAIQINVSLTNIWLMNYC